MHHDNTVAGHAELVFIGLQDGQSRSYRLSEIEVERDKILVFSFRYFQQLSGSVRLPRGFGAGASTGRCGAYGRFSRRFQQVFDWTKIQQPAAGNQGAKSCGNLNRSRPTSLKAAGGFGGS